MGNFYANYTLGGVGQDAVAGALRGRRCAVTPAVGGSVIVFDEESDAQDQRIISELAAKLSGELRCPVLALLNHDDDILWYQLYCSGRFEDEYDSTPGYFNPTGGPSRPAGGDAGKLCAAFGSTNVAEVEGILRRSNFDEDGYTFAFERHADLAKALGVSEFGVGTAYASFENDELPEGLAMDDVIRTR